MLFAIAIPNIDPKYVRFRCVRTLNRDFRVLSKASQICNSHFRDNPTTSLSSLFGVFAIVVTGC